MSFFVGMRTGPGKVVVKNAILTDWGKVEHMRTFDAQVLSLSALNQLLADLLKRLDVPRGEGDADLVDLGALEVALFALWYVSAGRCDLVATRNQPFRSWPFWWKLTVLGRIEVSEQPSATVNLELDRIYEH